MTSLELRFATNAVEQLLSADAWWREHRDKSPDLLATEFEAAVALLRVTPEVGASYPSDELADAKRFLLRRTRFHV